MTSRAKGYRQEREAPEAIPGIIAATQRLLLPTADHRPFRGERLYQRAANACLTFAKKRSIWVSKSIAAHRGLSTEHPVMISAQFDYEAARRGEFRGVPPEQVPPLKDVGSYPSISFQQTAEIGMVREEDAPYDDTRVNEALPVNLVDRAFGARGLDWFPIAETGPARLDVCADAMRRGFSINVGMSVDQAFEDWQGGAPITGINPAHIRGGHGIAILAILPGVVIFDNWWEDWGDADGTGRMTPACFESEAVTSVTAVRHVPRVAA